MSFLSLKIGDQLPGVPPGAPVCAQRGKMPDGPAWFVLKVMSMSENKVEETLRELGVDNAWHPIKKTVWRVKGGRHHGDRRETVSPAVPGYVLFRVTGFPRWDLLVGDLAPKGVIEALGGVSPVVISEEAVAQMEQVPDVLAEIVERERKRNELEEGCVVEMIDGVLRGNRFTVTELTKHEARGVLAGFGRMSVRREFLRKVV